MYKRKHDIYKDIAEDVETRFDTSNFELNRPSPKGKHKKRNWINERWIRGKHHDKFVGLRAKTYTYLRDHSIEDKKAKGTKKGVIKRKLKFENYENCLEATQFEDKLHHLEKKKINSDNL